jgi:hypothetical protein
LLVTDHQPLKWLMESDKLTGKLARWALMLMEYDFKVVHKAGLVNMDADGLSRNPIPSQADATGARWHVEEGEDSLPGWWLDVWFVIVCGRLLTLRCHSCNHFPLWDWAIGGA